MAKDIGIHKNLFGGYMMAWIDEAAATYACRVCEDPHLVTKKIGELEFIRPVRVGQQIRFYGEVERIGHTSIAINIEARRYNVASKNEKLVCSTDIVFVRISEEGEAIPISQEVKMRYKND